MDFFDNPYMPLKERQIHQQHLNRMHSAALERTKTLQSARTNLMSAQEEYLAARIEVHGNNAATRKEAFDRIEELTKACEGAVKLCRDNGVDPLNDRAYDVVYWLMDHDPDERRMIGWMCEVAALEDE